MIGRIRTQSFAFMLLVLSLLSLSKVPMSIQSSQATTTISSIGTVSYISTSESSMTTASSIGSVSSMSFTSSTSSGVNSVTSASSISSSTGTTTSSSAASCASSVLDQLKPINAGINVTKALLLAKNSSAYQADTKTYNVTYNSWFDNFHFNQTTCQITSVDIGVSFVLKTTNGPVNITEIFLDQQLTKVLFVLTFPYLVYGTGHISSDWSGYELYWSGYPSVYGAEASFTLPTVSVPPTSSCFNPVCDLAIWTGLTDLINGDPSFIAQTGSDEQISCVVSCTYTYRLWYEFVGVTSGASYCSLNPSPGDSILSYTINEAEYGRDSHYYDVETYDYNLGQGCSPGSPGYYPGNPNPIYADFIAEIAGCLSSCLTLAEFSIFSIHDGTMFYNGNWYGIYQSYTSGYYQVDSMYDTKVFPQIQDTFVGNVVCSGCFAEEWLSSA